MPSISKAALQELENAVARHQRYHEAAKKRAEDLQKEHEALKKEHADLWRSFHAEQNQKQHIADLWNQWVEVDKGRDAPDGLATVRIPPEALFELLSLLSR